MGARGSITVGSLFAGIGGFDLAAERVFGPGCVRWQVEIDSWAQRVLAKHWPHVPRFSDVREVTEGDLEPVDLVCGGFPCQPYSLAGERLGGEDQRALWPQMRRVVSFIKPTWIVGENVPGLISLGLDEVCTDLEALGFEVWTLGIPAVAVGAPHRRERIWIVAYSGCNGRFRRVEPRDGPQESKRGRQAERCQDRQFAQVGTTTSGGVRELGRWAPEPSVGRMAPRLPGSMDRLRGLGNAIVPQVAEFLFRRIKEANEQLTPAA